jgi:ribosomal protein S18 acetylase RimI-like enzyme
MFGDDLDPESCHHMTQIRTATIADLHPLVPLFDGYRQFYRHPPDEKAAREFLAARFAAKDSVIYVAAEEEDHSLSGFVQLYPLWSSTRLKRLWLLNDLYVHPAHRGRHISKLLIGRCISLAHDTGACGLQLETQKSNLIGNSLYRQQGFVLSGENFYFLKTD